MPAEPGHTGTASQPGRCAIPEPGAPFRSGVQNGRPAGPSDPSAEEARQSFKLAIWAAARRRAAAQSNPVAEKFKQMVRLKAAVASG